MTHNEHFEFMQTKLIVERVHHPRQYLSLDWLKDQQVMRDSVRRKQALRRQEQAQLAQFESWRHGQPVPAAEAEALEEERRAFNEREK